jgi:hypothetical protein
MTIESATQAICDLALRFGEGDEESMVSEPIHAITIRLICSLICFLFPSSFGEEFIPVPSLLQLVCDLNYFGCGRNLEAYWFSVISTFLTLGDSNC